MPARSDDGFSSLPEAIVQREEEQKEVIKRGSVLSEKQVAGADGIEAAEDFAYGLPLSRSGDQTISSAKQRSSGSKLSRRRIWVYSIVVLIILGIGLGVGLGFGLGSSQPSGGKGGGPNTESGPNSGGFSSRGAFNGTGIVAINFDDNSGSLKLFYQHYSGEIRLMNVTWPDVSQSTLVDEVVAFDAKNGTPISGTSIRPPGLSQQHVFYIGNDKMLKQRIFDNSTFSWADGPVNKQNIKVLDSDRIGLHSTYYADPIIDSDSNLTVDTTGLRLWVAKSETTFDQLAWRPGYSKWIYEQSWQDLNGHARPTANDLQAGHTSYVMFVDNDEKVNMYWRDTANDAESTSTHPINVWEKVSIDLPAVDPTAGLSWRSALFARIEDKSTIRGWNISFAAENSTIVPSDLPAFEGTCIPNTSIDVFAIPPDGVPDEVFFFCQTKGDDITLYSAGLSSNTWKKSILPLYDG